MIREGNRLIFGALPLQQAATAILATKPKAFKGRITTYSSEWKTKSQIVFEFENEARIAFVILKSFRFAEA